MLFSSLRGAHKSRLRDHSAIFLYHVGLPRFQNSAISYDNRQGYANGRGSRQTGEAPDALKSFQSATRQNGIEPDAPTSFAPGVQKTSCSQCKIGG